MPLSGCAMVWGSRIRTPSPQPGRVWMGTDHVNQAATPRTVDVAVPLAPDTVLKLIRCGCESL